MPKEPINIAIIIGVSEYENPSSNLPACKKDAESIFNILSITGKFKNILYINENISSTETKQKITEFIRDNSSNRIEELFFYFSGHGDFSDNEFYYVLSNYHPNKRNQTGLSNSEVDNFFRSLNPSLLIKVIDACQSGKTYIKDAKAIDNYFKSTGDSFHKCYFLTSSLSEQFSYASSEISFFTRSFINSLKEHDRNSTEIRYKDILDYISDEFRENTQQTPFFVTQATNTEIFCSLSQTLLNYLDNSIIDTNSLETAESNKSESLIDIIKEDAKQYVTEDQAIKLLDEIKNHIELYKIPGELEPLFTSSVYVHNDYRFAPKDNRIAEWLIKNPNDYYAKPIYQWLRKDRDTNPLSNIVPYRFGISHDYANDENYEQVLKGFDLTVEVPYKLIALELISNFPNINSYSLRLIYLLSNKRIRFFYYITNQESMNWSRTQLNLDAEWASIDCPITKPVHCIEIVDSILSALTSRLSDDIKNKFNRE